SFSALARWSLAGALLGVAAASVALADSSGPVLSACIQAITLTFKARVIVNNPQNSQTLVYQNNQLINSNSSSPTTSPWSVVLNNGNTSGGKTPTISDGDQLQFTFSGIASNGAIYNNTANHEMRVWTGSYTGSASNKAL